MKKIDIYAIGHYNKTKNIGQAVYYLHYKGAVIKRVVYINNTTSIATITLYALLHALYDVNEPCNITIHTKIGIGLKKPNQSQNKELIYQIMDNITSKGHVISIIDNDKFDAVNDWESKNKNKQTERKRKDTSEGLEISDADKASNTDWRSMYSDLMGISNDKWVPGSGGY